MVKKFAGRADAATWRLVAAACVLGPEALTSLKALLDRTEKSVRDFPEDGEARARLAGLLLRAGQAERAATLLEKIASTDQALPRRLVAAGAGVSEIREDGESQGVAGQVEVGQTPRGSTLAGAPGQRLVAPGGRGGQQGGWVTLSCGAESDRTDPCRLCPAGESVLWRVAQGNPIYYAAAPGLRFFARWSSSVPRTAACDG